MTMPDPLWHLLNGMLALAYLLPALWTFAMLMLVALCATLALIAARADKFNPDTLRWRALGFYAAAGLGYTLYTGYLRHLQARDWSLFQRGGDHHRATCSCSGPSACWW